MTEILDQSLEYRQNRIDTAKDYLERTRQLFESFGSTELKTSHARFSELLDALNANNVRLVVIGEFSRGKSSLVNALLGIHLLRSAQEATTAINTFVRALPESRQDKFIKIHYQDGRPSTEIAWTDNQVLEKWGTELDESHADARRQLDYIEIFTDHPLLQKGLTLIDTPGLQSVVAHHEAITRKAIAESHIALWVQSTSQLGGNATEWSFLSETIRQHFRKFVTVVNMWDAVLDPTDPQEKSKPTHVREREKMERVKRNFREKLSSLPEAEIDLLTNSDHLMGVSALWALGDDPDKKRRSGITKLSERIAEMFSSGEAMEQIFRKPLQQLSHMQQQLSSGLTEELELLASDKSMIERQRDLDMLDKDIKLQNEEINRITTDSKLEHNGAARHFIENVRQKLVAPLADLKAEIELQVDEQYVRKMIAKRVREISLPADLQDQFHTVSHQVTQAWEQQKKDLSTALEGLRTDYSQQMDKHIGRLRGQMSTMDIQIPDISIQFQLDFSEIEQYHQHMMTLQQEVEARQEEIESIEQTIAQHAANQAKLDMARQAISRAERMLDQHGPQPAPLTSSRRVRTSSGGMYSSPTYGTETYTDTSNQEAWKKTREEYEADLNRKEARMAEILAEEERKTGIRMSLQKAQQKYEREMADRQRKMAEYEKQVRQSENEMIQAISKKLIRSTAGQLDQRIRYLQDHASEAISKIFSDQLELLQNCVKEQFTEPLNAKRTQRQDVMDLMQKGQIEIAERKVRLTEARKQLTELHDLTLAALNS